MPSQPPRSMGKLHGVPDLPAHYIAREEVLALLKQKLLSGPASVAITGQGQAVGMQGMGGIGKTVLATALISDPEVSKSFPHGIFWLTVGQNPTALMLAAQLLRWLTDRDSSWTSDDEYKDVLREALDKRQVLIVLDDLWRLDHVAFLPAIKLPSRLLVTTRNREVLIALGAGEQRVNVLSPEDARRILAVCSGTMTVDQLPHEATEIAKECGYLPLALAMIGAMIQLESTPTAWKDALVRLRQADLAAITRIFPSYTHRDLLCAIQVSIQALEPVDQERYFSLAIFPDGAIPEEPFQRGRPFTNSATSGRLGRNSRRGSSSPEAPVS
jgi:hypothetical protein